jgi:hypothetical protein
MKMKITVNPCSSVGSSSVSQGLPSSCTEYHEDRGSGFL